MAEEILWEGPTIFRGWTICPVDVLLQIFEELDSQSLLNCLSINSWWREAVDYYAQHSSRWRDIAEAGMENRGRKFRDKSLPDTGWRDLFFNYNLWKQIEEANISWGYFKQSEEIQILHVFRDTLLTGHGEKEYNIGGEMYRELNMVQHKIQDILPSNNEQNESYVNLKSKEKHFNDDILIHDDQSYRIKEKLLKECPFTKYSVFDDDCFYILDERNVMRRFRWDGVEEKWTDEVLGRYYGCSRSIKDIHIVDGDVYILLKTGTVMKTDRDGRNFENSAYLDLSPQSLICFMRLLRSPVLRTLETAYKFTMPLFATGPNVLFHKFSAVVGVPLGNKFNIRRQKDIDQVVLECPDLSHALEHGEMLLLGYNDGRVDICRVQDLFEIGYKPKLTFNILECPNCPEIISDPAVVAIEVFESSESHHLFVATRFNIYTISLTYPERVKDSISVMKRCIS